VLFSPCPDYFTIKYEEEAGHIKGNAALLLNRISSFPLPDINEDV
jgi:hypothetical protein